MHVTPATAADTPALCKLLDLLFTQEAEFMPDRDAQIRGLRAIVDDAALGTILVAREDGEVVGMVNLLWTVSTALGARVALLEDMVMAPDVRGRGLGGELLEAAVRYARERGCRRITLLTDADNDRAQAFYRRHGFVASPMLPFRRLLD
ncbi:MAG TPA: GNAT family N-acetyltransferase [Gammaproteobacteria bacterium]|nr:GNAT family N-acetyltransferase [Gammaproteobacteria bacterium]